MTTTGPLVAPQGTATILVELQLAGTARAPLRVTVLDPCVAPKLDPVIVTAEFAVPEVGFRLVMLGAPLTGLKAITIVSKSLKLAPVLVKVAAMEPAVA